MKDPRFWRTGLGWYKEFVDSEGALKSLMHDNSFKKKGSKKTNETSYRQGNGAFRDVARPALRWQYPTPDTVGLGASSDTVNAQS
jgi:hypothetical protein